MSALCSDDVASDAIAELVRYCLGTDLADLSAEVVHATKRQIVDTVGVALAGRDADGVSQLRELTREFGGRPEALMWGTPWRVPAQDAGRVNATMAHALEFDDTYEPAVLHPAVMTVPTAFTVAELCSGAGPVTGAAIIEAVALGVDIACRLARAGRPGVPGFETGWHNTSLFGYFSATIVAGRLLRLTETELVSALGIAYHQCGGNAQAHLEGALTKRMGPGFGAYAGILAARLAQRGVSGVTGVLEGDRGLFRQYFGGDYSRSLMLDGLGSEFAGTSVSFKPWPACRGAHTAIDAALSLVTSHDLDAVQIERVTIRSGPGEYAMLAAPLERKRRPQSVVEAQFSVPWVVAAALQDGAVTLTHLGPEALCRSDLLALTERIETAQDASLARPGGGPGGACVELRLRNGSTLRATSRRAPGGPDQPMSDEQLGTKFLGCTESAGVPRTGAERLLGLLTDLENVADVTRVVDELALPALQGA